MIYPSSRCKIRERFLTDRLLKVPTDRRRVSLLPTPKEVMFLMVFVCMSVRKQDYSQTIHRSVMKFYQRCVSGKEPICYFFGRTGLRSGSSIRIFGLRSGSCGGGLQSLYDCLVFNIFILFYITLF